MVSVQMHNRLYIKHSYELSLWREGVVNIEITHLQMCNVRPLMNKPGSLAGSTWSEEGPLGSFTPANMEVLSWSDVCWTVASL